MLFARPINLVGRLWAALLLLVAPASADVGRVPRIKWLCISFGVFVVGLVSPSTLRADFIALTLDTSRSNVDSSVNNQTLGWAFTTNQSITVTQLGTYDHNLDGLGEAHAVGLWSATGTLLTSGTIGAGTSVPLLANFRYVDVPDVTLPAGQTFVIGVFFRAGTPDPIASSVPASDFSFSPSISYLSGRRGNGTGLPFPGIVEPPDRYFGPNFQFTTAVAAVPEPASLALAGLGAVCVAAARLRKRPAGRPALAA